MTTFEKMINLDAKVEVSTIKTIAGLIFEIDCNGKDTKIDLIEILLQLVKIGFKIRSLKIVIFFLLLIKE